MVLSGAATAGLAKLMEPIIDDVFKSENVHMLQVVSLGVLGLFLIKGLASYGESLTMNYIGQRIIANIQTDLFSHLIRADLQFFHAHSSGTLMSRCTNDVNLMKGVVSNTITSLGKDFITLIFLVSVMFYQDWVLSSITFFVFPVAVIPIVRIGKRMRKISTHTQQETGAFLSFLKEVFQGARLVKAYNMEAHEINRAKKVIESLLKLSLKSNRIKSLSSPIMETLGGIAIVVVISYGGYEVIQGKNTAGAFFSFIAALLLAYEPMKRLANLNANLQEGLAAATRIFSILDGEPHIQDMPDARIIPIKKGEVSFKKVDFQYETGKQVLKEVSFEIPTGKRIALVGPSGSGKSTLMNLIPRFYDIEKGAILIDGVNIKEVSLMALRNSMALVSQEVTLFDDTIRANILYGRPGASEEDIIKAAKDAAAHAFILKLPKGYDTVVGESGVKLSGGQRQRLSIARALLKNAPLLLLDEATSSLDTKSEHEVQKALDRLMKGRTCLIVAHRLSTVRNAHNIVVLEEGKIVEQGTHNQLVKKAGVYAQLCQWQLVKEDHA
jgi:subfamily B ATP-binding cassette protein MsbA